MSHKIKWSQIHKVAGCHRCFFADREKLDRDACCTYPGKLAHNKDDGSCGTRRDLVYQVVKRQGGEAVKTSDKVKSWFPELVRLLDNFSPSEIVIRLDNGVSFEIMRQDR